jgi:hypothetical protein
LWGRFVFCRNGDVSPLQPKVIASDPGVPMTHEEFISCLAERVENVPIKRSKDQDRGKGAVEQHQNNEGGNTSMSGQLGHRDEDVELKKR